MPETDEGMGPEGLEILALCVQSNVDQATWMHDSIVASKDQEIERLRNQVQEMSLREWRSEQRIRWLMGYGVDDFAEQVLYEDGLLR